MDKKIKVFGAALDALDDPIKVLAKCSYINKLAQNLIELERDFLDPYDGLLKLSSLLKKEEFIKIGKFPIETWLTPKPKIEDYPLLDPLKYQEFVNSGAVKKVSVDLERFVSDKILPDIPLMIGADHSLTGGILNALSKKYGSENILIIIFDAHFDAIPASISLNLVKYMKEHQNEINILNPEILESINTEQLVLNDTYSYASFLDHLIYDSTILPQNLIIFGCQDYPSEEMLAVNDPRVKQYVDFYLSFKEKGVRFIPAAKNSKEMIEKLEQILHDRNIQYLYLSFDVDVGVFKEVLAARIMNVIGIEEEIILNAAKVIKDFMKLKKCELIGLDILEIDTYLLGIELKKSGRKDQTVRVIDNFLNIIFS
ncbi:MAG: arginase family protein [Candidatus Hermodarchaeota archaeon]